MIARPHESPVAVAVGVSVGVRVGEETNVGDADAADGNVLVGEGDCVSEGDCVGEGVGGPCGGVTTRTRITSPTTTVPLGATATHVGALKRAASLGPPSPLQPITPAPAYVEMKPLPFTTRTTWLPESTINALPAASKSSPGGAFANSAAVARPPSPAYPTPAPTAPAKFVTTRDQ